MKNRNGFTIVELIIVIIILSILAVAAYAQFINLRSAANISVLEALGGNISSAAHLVYTKAAITGVAEQSTANVDIDNDGTNDVEVHYGYPSDDRSNGITAAMGADFENNWGWSTRLAPDRVVIANANFAVGGAGQKVNNVPVTTNQCYLIYYAATATTRPTIEYVTTGC